MGQTTTATLIYGVKLGEITSQIFKSNGKTALFTYLGYPSELEIYTAESLWYDCEDVAVFVGIKSQAVSVEQCCYTQVPKVWPPTDLALSQLANVKDAEDRPALWLVSRHH